MQNKRKFSEMRKFKGDDIDEVRVQNTENGRRVWIWFMNENGVSDSIYAEVKREGDKWI